AVALVGCIPQPSSGAPAPAVSPTSGPPTTPAPTTVAAATIGVVGTWAPSPRSRTSGCSIQSGLPDGTCTPGALDPRVNQGDLDATVSSRGYTAIVRPPVNVTERIKRDQMVAYGLQGRRLADYELDHLISLELGGSPDDVANLWPEPWTGEGNAHQKDAVENLLNREVCWGIIQLVDAQRVVATDWLAVYRGRGLQPAP